MSRLGALHLTRNTGVKHTATVIFLHGSGSNGEDMQEWVRLMVKTFTFPHIKVMYPTAPLQPYTAAGGAMSNVWFDRVDVSPHVPEKLQSITNIAGEIMNLIKKENDDGIPTNRIIVGGFSMGGALAMQIGLRFERNLAGMFALSSFLNDDSAVYKDLENNNKVPYLLQVHGDKDELVDLSWGQTTFNRLKALGVQGEFHVLPKLGHSINKRGIEMTKQWIEKSLPENE